MQAWHGCTVKPDPTFVPGANDNEALTATTMGGTLASQQQHLQPDAGQGDPVEAKTEQVEWDVVPATTAADLAHSTVLKVASMQSKLRVRAAHRIHICAHHPVYCEHVAKMFACLSGYEGALLAILSLANLVSALLWSRVSCYI